MTVEAKIREVKNILKKEIEDRIFYGYDMKETYAKRAYEHALRLVDDIAKEYKKEYMKE